MSHEMERSICGHMNGKGMGELTSNGMDMQDAGQVGQRQIWEYARNTCYWKDARGSGEKAEHEGTESDSEGPRTTHTEYGRGVE